MLFNMFASQKERREFGGSDFVELQLCKGKPNAQWEEIVHWQNNSLYIFGDDMEEFYAQYKEIFQDGLYPNGERGLVDYCGVTYYTLEQTMYIIEMLKREQPRDFQVLLDWLANAEKYDGLYFLGV